MPYPNASVRLPKAQLRIDGRWCEAASGETLSVINPATELPFATIALAGASDVDRAVQAVHRAFEQPSWPRMRPLDRGRLLEKLALLIEAEADELATLESLGNGKPLAVSRHVDLRFTVDALRYSGR